MRLLPLFVLAAGCGSNWDLRKGEELPLGCANLYNYYVDADGDGWGEAGQEGTPLCGPDGSLTASNNLDCDDGDPEITGRIHSHCPADLDADAPAEGGYSGFLYGDSEFVAVFDDYPTARFGTARDKCTAWAGTSTPEAQDQGTPGHRGLALLADDVELDAVAGWLEANVAPPFAAFLAIRWDGTDPSSGSWVWEDGTTASINQLPWCSEEPTVASFYPEVIPGLAETDAALAEHADEVRLALVYDGEGWCLGVPGEAGEPYDAQYGHYVCERPKPNLADYADASAG